MANWKGKVLCSHSHQTEVADYWNSRGSKSQINLPYLKIAHGRNNNTMEIDKHGKTEFVFRANYSVFSSTLWIVKPKPEASG